MRYIALFLQNLLVAQSFEWRVLGGVKMSSRWQRKPYILSGIDTYFQVEAAQSIPLSTYSLIYSHIINSKWAWNAGINLNAKGYIEKGTVYDYTALYPYAHKNTNIDNYIGCLVGGRYNLLDNKTWKINTEIFINPEIRRQGYLNIKQLAVSSTVTLSIEKPIDPHISVVFNPFFETALMHYTKTSSFNVFRSFLYTPLGYGLMFGFKAQ